MDALVQWTSAQHVCETKEDAHAEVYRSEDKCRLKRGCLWMYTLTEKQQKKTGRRMMRCGVRTRKMCLCARPLSFFLCSPHVAFSELRVTQRETQLKKKTQDGGQIFGFLSITTADWSFLKPCLPSFLKLEPTSF